VWLGSRSRSSLSERRGNLPAANLSARWIYGLIRQYQVRPRRRA